MKQADGGFCPHDPRLIGALLYSLSYTGMFHPCKTVPRFERAT